MTTKKTTKSAKKKTAEKSPLQMAVQEALQVTWVLKGKLKSAQMAYLKIGAMLAQVRDKKMFSTLKHPDIEEYAQKRLKLRRASLYRYLQVYDWVRKSHAKWLEPKPEGFIPYFTDAVDLMWIENRLEDAKLAKEARKELETLKAKALEGQLKDGELDKWRKKRGSKSVGLKTLLSNVRLIRRRSSELKNMPAEAIKLMDELIEILDNALDAQPGK